MILMQVYSKILLETDFIYQNNDKTTKRVKSSRGEKYMNMIKPIWEEMKTSSNHVGEGLKLFTENPVDYKCFT